MASVTLVAVEDRFPDGTEVQAFARPTAAPPLTAAQLGDPVDMQTVTDGSLTFDGLDAGALFVAYAVVDLADVFVGFATPAPASGGGGGGVPVAIITDPGDLGGLDPGAIVVFRGDGGNGEVTALVFIDPDGNPVLLLDEPTLNHNYRFEVGYTADGVRTAFDVPHSLGQTTVGSIAVFDGAGTLLVHGTDYTVQVVDNDNLTVTFAVAPDETTITITVTAL